MNYQFQHYLTILNINIMASSLAWSKDKMSYLVFKQTPGIKLINFMEQLWFGILGGHLSQFVINMFEDLSKLTLLMLETEYSGFGGSIPCLLMHWLLKSSVHQQAWYQLCRTDNMYCCTGVNFIYLGQTKSKIGFKMWIYLLWYIKQFSKLKVNTFLCWVLILILKLEGVWVFNVLRKSLSTAPQD